MNRSAAILVMLCVVLVPSDTAVAQPLSYTGVLLTENFNSMGLNGTSTPAGWFVGWQNGYPPGTAGSVVRDTNVTVNSGVIGPSGIIAGFNCGTNDATGGFDRSLGTGATGTSSPNGTNRFIEVQIQNNSGDTLRAIEMIYTGKQWRTSSSASGQAFTNYFQAGTDGINYVFMGPAFDFRTPVTGPPSVPLNGNAGPNMSADLGGIYTLPNPLPPGGSIYLRWLDVNDPSTDPVLAIDDFSFRGFTSVPEIVISNEITYTFTVFAGQVGVSGSDDGVGTAAQFRAPHAIAADAQGNLYVADTGNHVVREITPQAKVLVLAGLSGVPGTNNGTLAAARFNLPEGICVDSSGNIYVSEIGSHTIRRITPAGMVELVAGLPGSTGTNDGFGTMARFNVPVTVQVDANGFLYVGDFANHTVRLINPSGFVSTLAGSGGVGGTQDGPVSQARFYYPHTCLPDNEGNVYVADLENHAVRKISGGMVSTLAGSPRNSGTNDGIGKFARFVSPWGLAFEASGNLLVTDRQNHTLRRVSLDGRVKTIGGVARMPGSTDGRGTQARFNLLRGVTLNPRGELFVVDTGNQTVRIGRPDPTLRATLQNGAVIFSWPSWVMNYALETSPVLPGTNWMLVMDPPTAVGGRNYVTNALTDAAGFFRLRAQ